MLYPENVPDPVRRKLFLSWTALLRSMAEKSVTSEDLATGLFCLSHPREDVIHPESDEVNELDDFFPDRQAGFAAHDVLVEAILKAEREGRAVFPEARKARTFALVNSLLAHHGYPPLVPTNRVVADCVKCCKVGLDAVI